MESQDRRNLKKIYPITSLVLLAISLLLVASASFAENSSRAKAITIDKLKALDINRLEEKKLKQKYTVEGYFVNDPVPMLVRDLKFMRINTPIPESEYIILTGPGIERFAEQRAIHGSRVKVTCNLAVDEKLLKDKKTLILDCPDLPIVLKKGIVYDPKIINICKKYPKICELITAKPGKYALLYSGGINAMNAHKRYWNDLKFMYMTLRSKYGFASDHIVVVYKNGIAEDSEMTVNYSASPADLGNAINSLKSKMTAQDDFFLFVTNHGGGYHDTTCGETKKSWGGRADSNPGDEVDTFKWDEEIYYYNQPSNDLWDDDFATLINSLSFKKMTAVFEQCFSGGFLRDLRGSNRILLAAASEFQFSWALGPQYSYDTFSYYLTCALNKSTETGGTLDVNPDTDGDGNVSILEAFLYAKSHDKDCETVLLEDSGDGVGSNTPSATGTDGNLASQTHL